MYKISVSFFLILFFVLVAASWLWAIRLHGGVRQAFRGPFGIPWWVQIVVGGLLWWALTVWGR